MRMDTIQIVLSSGEEFSATVEEHVPCDPSSYQWESGWFAVKDDTTEAAYFVSEEGVVYDFGTDHSCGIAPEIKAEADRYESMIEEAFDHVA